MCNIIEKLQILLIENHGEYFRDFPWRHTKEPYLIMIAEFMLHRTRAEQVIPVYNDFILRYPDVYSLSNVNIEDLKFISERLGLHWRIDHFINSARYICDNFDGKFPENRDELQKIPGVGEYASGAISTVCFNKKEHVVDSNIARFLNRILNLGLSGEIRRKKEIIDAAKELFNTGDTGKILFSLLDFTAIICKPQMPRCNLCMLAHLCRYYARSATSI